MAFTFLLKPQKNKNGKVDKKSKTVKVDQDIENIQKFADTLLKILLQHKDVLQTKKQQMQYKDDYGLLIDDGWNKEKRYFVEKVVFGNPELYAELVKIVSRNHQDFFVWTGAEPPPMCNKATRMFLLFYCINNNWKVKVCYYYLEHECDSYKSKASCSFVVKRLLDDLIKSNIDPEKEWLVFDDVHAKQHFIDKMCELVDTFLSKLVDNKKKIVSTKKLSSPLEYEKEIANKLKELDFNARATKGSGDQGADVLANKNGVKFAIQCKMYSKPVGNKAVQEANTARDFYKCDYAVVVTNAGFTKSARQVANACNVILLNEKQLDKLDKYTE